MDVQPPSDIPAHRPDIAQSWPEGRVASSGSLELTRKQSLEDWGDSLAISVPLGALSPIKTRLDEPAVTPASSFPGFCTAPLCCSSKPLQLNTERSPLPHCPGSVETELESLLGNAVKGVLLGER